MENLINDDFGSNSSDRSNNEYDNESDNESNNDSDNESKKFPKYSDNDESESD